MEAASFSGCRVEDGESPGEMADVRGVMGFCDRGVTGCEFNAGLFDARLRFMDWNRVRDRDCLMDDSLELLVSASDVSTTAAVFAGTPVPRNRGAGRRFDFLGELLVRSCARRKE